MNNLNTNGTLKQKYIFINNVRFQLERQILKQETNNSGWRFDEISSMTNIFYKTTEMNGSNHVKFPLRISTVLDIETNDKNCFVWSTLVSLQPCHNNHHNRVSIYREYFVELDIQGFDFTHGFVRSRVHKLEKLNNLSLYIFELNFYQDQNE